ncbi:AraC family transcriptional regulator [Kitasatospora azatica]|uniref:AraC family transcriptional regulator n=1 Tax=Kitasatospora azatica TaxID=58347 RepID=UPI00056208E1|nr:AraC family transcriptional regulator [Kitasatospora azatica]
MDVLSDAITVMRTGRPHAGRHPRVGRWGIRFPDSGGIGFHSVLRGSVWLYPPDGAEPFRLDPGDLALLPHGRGYGLADAPDAELRPARMDPDGRLRPQPTPADPDDPDASRTLCGAYLLNQARPHPLIAELPPVLRLTTAGGRHPALRAVIELLDAELTDRQPGADAAVQSLLDTLLLYTLRAWFAEQSARTTTGWATALQDRAIAAALGAIHADPAHPWTVEELGALAGLSRAAFARRFTALVGQPPLAYLTWWRMTTAGRLLRESDAPLRSVAQQTGYLSEFAFAKAFKREYALPPGRYRDRTA